jgi:hypothetical protein
MKEAVTDAQQRPGFPLRSVFADATFAHVELLAAMMHELDLLW